MNNFLNAKSVTFHAYYKEDEEGLALPILQQDEENISIEFDVKDFDCLELQLLFDDKQSLPSELHFKTKVAGDPLLLIVEPKKEIPEEEEPVKYHDYQIDDVEQELHIELNPMTRELNIDAWGWINQNRKAVLSVSATYQNEKNSQFIKTRKEGK
ncbi:MAG: hypothetical protein PHN72_01445 [Bacilli bacterium]|nr:hypothetical protein [Bacilli bacterium]